MIDRARTFLVIFSMWGAAILAGIIAVYLTISPANAHPMLCGQWAEMQVAFEQDGFVTTGVGVVDENRVTTLMQAEEGDRWILLIVASTDGSACIVTMGEYWMQDALPEAPVAGKRPA